MLLRDGWEPYRSGVHYVSTGQDYDPRKAHTKYDPGEAYWRLSGMVDRTFGPAGATVKEVYEQLLRSEGLSSYETKELVKGAVGAGYLKNVRL
jgi:hypothetical protein